MADCKNLGSNNVLIKVGLTFVEQFYFDGVEHNWYKIEKEEYARTELMSKALK